MQKIVINKCYGGFELSEKALRFIGTPLNYSYYDIPRDSLELVLCVEALGELANGPHTDLKIVEIPDNVEWKIEEYDGVEWIAEVHRTWS